MSKSKDPVYEKGFSILSNLQIKLFWIDLKKWADTEGTHG